MNFQLNDEQRALQDSVSRVLGKVYAFEQRQQVAASQAGWSKAVWAQLAELGVAGLLVPQEFAGFGGSLCDMLPVMEEFGRSLALEPLLASSVLATTALRLGTERSVQARTLASLADGSKIGAWAHDEALGRHAPLWVQTRAVPASQGWRLHGAKYNVLHGASADFLVVSARVAGDPADGDGLALFLVDAPCQGVGREAFRFMDDSVAAEISFDDAPAELVCAQGPQALRAIEGTQAAGIAALCADSVGAMENAYRLAVEYVQIRKQFGRFIGENQALRHRLAEMLVSLETARSMAIAAAIAADDFESEAARADLQRAKIVVGRQGRNVCHGAVQAHGGIGMTEEYAVGHCLRRVVAMDQLFGDTDAHIARRAEAFAAE